MVIWLAKYWKVGLALLLVLAAAGIVLHYRHVMAENARLEAANQQQADLLEAEKKAREQIVNSGKQYEKIKNDVRAVQGGCVGPAANAALNGLRDSLAQ